MSEKDVEFLTVTNCAPNYLHSDNDRILAAKCCAPRISGLVEDTGAKVIVASGEQSTIATTSQPSYTEWQGAPLNGVGAFHTSRVWPMMPAHVVLANPAYNAPFQVFLKRAYADAHGQYKSLEWPVIVWEPGDSMVKLLRQLSEEPHVAIDTETTGLDPLVVSITCIGIASKHGGVSVPWPIEGLEKDLVLQILRSSKIKKTMHNGAYDMQVFRTNAIEIDGYDFDTLQAHAIISPRLPHNLGFVAICDFPIERWKTTFKNYGVTTVDERIYNAKDAISTALLRDALSSRLDRTHKGWELFQTAMQLQKVCMEMQRAGAKIDDNARFAHRDPMLALKAELAKKYEDLNGINVSTLYPLGAAGTGPSIKRLFFEHLQVPPTSKSKKTGAPSLDAEGLTTLLGHTSRLVSENARIILNYREITKLLNTYIENLPVREGFIHTQWNNHGAITGRWSSSNPNLQNWPKRLRNTIVPRNPNSYIVEADYSQLELRIIALLAKDELLLQWYRENADVHTKTAASLFKVPEDKVEKGQRNMAKTIEYGFNYNITDDVSTVWATLVVNYPSLTQRQVSAMRRQWFKDHPALLTWQYQQIAIAEKEGYVEEPLSGRRQYFYDWRIDPNKVLNYPVQGFASTLMNRAVLECAKGIDWKETFIVAQVHDALYLEGPDPDYLVDLLKKSMVQVIEMFGNKMDFPIDVHIGKSMLTH